jgi:hypothetical protein
VRGRSFPIFYQTGNKLNEFYGSCYTLLGTGRFQAHLTLFTLEEPRIGSSLYLESTSSVAVPGHMTCLRHPLSRV